MSGTTVSTTRFCSASRSSSSVIAGACAAKWQRAITWSIRKRGCAHETEVSAHGALFRSPIPVGPDGAVYVTTKAPGFFNGFSVARVTGAGVLDLSYGTAGYATTPGFGEFARSIVVQADGRAVVTGRSHPDSAVARFTATGVPDPSFGTDGKVKVFAGCNGGEGTYRVSGKELTFESLGLTEKACADPLVNELETAVSALFRGPQPVTWEITVDRLSLRGKDGGLDLVAKKG